MSVEIRSTNSAVRAVVEGKAPPNARLAAARGILPLPQVDMLELLVHLASDSDSEIAAAAGQTLDSQEQSSLEGLFSADDIAPSVLGYFCRRDGLSNGIYESLIKNPETPAPAIVEFAGRTKNG